MPYFIDSGAWIALAVEGDPYHERARERWKQLLADGGKPHTSVPLCIETFTFLDRNTDRKTALTWKDQVFKIPRLRIMECKTKDLNQSWVWFDRKEFHKLSSVDATSFVLMQKYKITHAFTFDTHFAVAGFELL